MRDGTEGNVSEWCALEGFGISGDEACVLEGKFTYTTSRKRVVKEKLYFT
jgi:hypothetical protein